MTDKLVEYMVEVNKNPEALAKHKASPEAAAKEFGLEDCDVKLITDNNVDEIQKRCDSSPTDTKGLAILTYKS